MLSRDELLKAIRGPIKMIEVPEWGGDIGVRRLTAGELVQMRAMMPGPIDVESVDGEEIPLTLENNLAITCKLLAAGLCDAEGAAVFTADELRGWDNTQRAVRDRLIEAVQEHNGLGVAAAEDREKNSAGGQTSDST